MQDTSIKGNGTSRFIKGASNFPTSFEEFRRQIMAGTLTADIGLNPAGCDVVGTALSKANLLTDQTAKLLALTGSSTVNEAFEKIAKWKGAAGGLATLDSKGKVPSDQLPPVEKPDLTEYLKKTDLSSSVSSTSTTTPANSYAAYTAYQKGVSAYNRAGDALSAANKKLGDPGITYLECSSSNAEFTSMSAHYTKLGHICIVSGIITTNASFSHLDIDISTPMAGMASSGGDVPVSFQVDYGNVTDGGMARKSGGVNDTIYELYFNSEGGRNPGHIYFSAVWLSLM